MLITYSPWFTTWFHCREKRTKNINFRHAQYRILPLKMSHSAVLETTPYQFFPQTLVVLANSVYCSVVVPVITILQRPGLFNFVTFHHIHHFTRVFFRNVLYWLVLSALFTFITSAWFRNIYKSFFAISYFVNFIKFSSHLLPGP